MAGTISPVSGRPSTGAKDEPKPWSKVRVWRDESSEKGPRYWVQIQRPGSDKLEEYSYRQFIGTPSNTEEDRLIKQEVQRQYRELEKEWRENASKVAVQSNDDAEKTEEKPPVSHTFEILRIVADRSPTAKDFDPNRHFTIYYRHEGAERHDVPASLDRMISASPEKFPKDIKTIIKTALCAKYTNLRAECGHQEPPAIAPEAEEALDMALAPEDVPTATPEASTGIEMKETAVGTSVGGEAPPVTPAPDEGDVLARQREWLARLQAVQDEQSRKLRPILVQHRKTDTWHPWTECPHKDRIYTAGTLLNEVVFDFDTEDWSAIIQEGGKLLAYLKAEGIPYQLAWSGGKGIHVHVFVDMGSVELDPALAGHLEDRAEYGLDVPVVVRRALYDHIAAEAGVNIKRAGLDPLKVDFSTARKGSMMRAFGCLRPKAEKYAGGVKTLLDDIPEQRPKPGDLPLRFPEKIELWDVNDLSGIINDALRKEISEASREAFTPKAIEGPLSSVPCYAHLRANGAPVGLRNEGALTISIFNLVHGRPLEEAQAEVRAYSLACSVSGELEREHQATLEGVYRRGYRGASCKHIRGKFGEKICNKDRCPLSEQARTTSCREALPASEGPEVEALWRYTVDPTRKIPLDQLWRWPDCFAKIGLKCSVPLETCEADLVAALERSGADADQVKDALEVVQALYAKYALGEDRIDKRTRDNLEGCGRKVGENFLADWPLAKGGRREDAQGGERSGADLATEMMNIIKKDCRSTLFHTPIGNPFIHLWCENHFEVRALDDSFETFITNEFRKRTGMAAPPNAVRTALNNLAAEAIMEGGVHDLRIRVAHRVGGGGRLEVWIDRGNNHWDAIRITADGYEIVENPPILFKRTRFVKEMVEPVQGEQPGALTELIDKLIHCKYWQKPMVEIEFITVVLAIAEELATVDKGGEGSGKSSKSWAEKALIDPMGHHESNIFKNPDRDEDLELYLLQTFIAAVDNVSSVNGKRSDLFCTAITQGLWGKRGLYRNMEMITEVFRCAVRLNGVSNPLKNADVLERTIEYTFEGEPNPRLSKTDWWTLFDSLAPYALADLLDKVALAMRVHQERPWTGPIPRMGEWYLWAIAAAEAIGMSQDEFIELFRRFEDERNQTALDNDPLGPILMAIADAENPSVSTMDTLLGLDEPDRDEYGNFLKNPRWLRRRAEQAGIDWHRDKMPKDAARLGKRIERLISTLAKFGYEAIKGWGRDVEEEHPELASKIPTYLRNQRIIVLRRKNRDESIVKTVEGDGKTVTQQQLYAGE